MRLTASNAIGEIGAAVLLRRALAAMSAKLEELPPRVAPAQRLDDRTRLPVGKIEAIVAVEGVGLQNAGVTGQMPLGMLPRSIARGVEQRRWWVLAAERPVVADIHPRPTGHRLALGEDGNRRVVAMQPLGGQDMALNQRVQRAQRRGAGADLIGERRQAEVDALAGIALALPVERLMLSELLEQDHRQQARTGKATRRDMERRRRLGDGLASPAGEPLSNRLNHLPLTGDDLERLRDILAELRQLRRTAAGAALRRRDHDPLAGQMLRKGPPRRPPALEGFDDCRRRGAFRRQLVLDGVRLGVLQLHLQLVEKPLLTFRARAIKRAPKLLDLQLQSRNQRLGARCRRARMRQIGFSVRRARFALKPRGSLGEDHRMRCGKVGGERINRPGHIRRESQAHGFVSKNPQPAAVGRQVFCGIRQSIPSSR